MRYKYRTLIPIFLTFLVAFELLTYATIATRPTQPFFELFVLGSNGTAADYFPNSTNLAVGENVNWTLGVVNQMGSMQLADIRVKLGNETIISPNDTQATPSPAPLVTEFKHFILANETWTLPFSWHVSNYTSSDGRVMITKLSINNVTYPLQDAPTCQTGVSESCSFKLIFELWTWNTDDADFQFGWWNGQRQIVAWLQIWFGLGTPSGLK